MKTPKFFIFPCGTAFYIASKPMNNNYNLSFHKDGNIYNVNGISQDFLFKTRQEAISLFYSRYNGEFVLCEPTLEV